MCFKALTLFILCIDKKEKKHIFVLNDIKFMLLEMSLEIVHSDIYQFVIKTKNRYIIAKAFVLRDIIFGGQ